VNGEQTLVRKDGLFVGTPDALAVFKRGQGGVWVSWPQEMRDGRRLYRVRLAVPDLPGSRRPTVPAALVIGAGVMLGVTVAVLLAVVALAWVAAHLGEVVGVAFLGFAAVYLAGAVATGCPGLHCAGCRH